MLNVHHDADDDKGIPMVAKGCKAMVVIGDDDIYLAIGECIL